MHQKEMVPSKGNGAPDEAVNQKTGKPNDKPLAIVPKYQDRKLNVNNLLKSANFFLNVTLNVILNSLNEIIPRSLIKQNTTLKFPITINDPNHLLQNNKKTQQNHKHSKNHYLLLLILLTQIPSPLTNKILL